MRQGNRLVKWARRHETCVALVLRDAILGFIQMSDGRWHGVNVLDILNRAAGAFDVRDRGHLDLARIYLLNQGGGFFVT
jgi:hypothetical protein